MAIREFLDNLSQAELTDRLRLALDGASLGIWDWDLRDDSVQFDRRWCEMLGLDHAATPMQLSTWAERVHPDDIDACYVDIKAHIEGRTERYENVHRMRHADGRWIFILDRGRISGRDEQGKPIRFTGTHFDVTAVEEARRIIAQRKRQLRELVDNMPTGVAMFDRQLVLLAASTPWRRLHGVEEVEVVGQALSDLVADPERWLPGMRAALDGTTSGNDEERVDDAHGERWFRWSARPWRTGEGAVEGVIFSTEDVSESVARRRAAEREREARIASLALFAGGIAHEINSPLQIVLSEIELLRMDQAEHPFPARSIESIDSIHRTVRRAAAIARALRNFSRDAGGDPLETVDLTEVLRDVEALSRKRVESAGIELTIAEPTAPVRVVGRNADLIHILLNLVSNASDAALAGEHWVSVALLEEEQLVRVRCTDGGPGIPAEHRPHLKVPFFTTKPAGRGTGLGLSIADSLAQRNEASVELLDGTPNTTFELVLRRPRGPA